MPTVMRRWQAQATQRIGRPEDCAVRCYMSNLCFRQQAAHCVELCEMVEMRLHDRARIQVQIVGGKGQMAVEILQRRDRQLGQHIG